MEVLLDLEDSIERLEALVERMIVKATTTEAALKRIEARTTRTESRLCQFMQDQGSEIYLPESGPM